MTMPPTFQGQKPDTEQEAIVKATAEHWRKVGNEGPVQALARVEEAAKQIVALTGTLQGLYFAVIAFSDLRKQATGLLFLPFLLPVVFWLASLLFATLVFVPRVRTGADLDDINPGAWLKIRDTYTATVNTKRLWLNWSHWLLVSSFAVVLGLLFWQSFLPPAPDPGPTHIIIETPVPLPISTIPVPPLTP